MKYIKSFQIFENNDFREIKDMLLPLEQDGFTIYGYHDDYHINVSISKGKKQTENAWGPGGFTTFTGFIYSEVEDCVNHFISYTFSKGYKIDHIRIIYHNKTPNNIFNIENIDRDKKISELGIYLK